MRDEIKARFDEFIRKYGERSGSGYVLSCESLLKSEPNEERQSTNLSDRVAGETPARERKDETR